MWGSLPSTCHVKPRVKVSGTKCPNISCVGLVALDNGMLGDTQNIRRVQTHQILTVWCLLPSTCSVMPRHKCSEAWGTTNIQCPGFPAIDMACKTTGGLFAGCRRSIHFKYGVWCPQETDCTWHARQYSEYLEGASPANIQRLGFFALDLRPRLKYLQAIDNLNIKCVCSNALYIFDTLHAWDLQPSIWHVRTSVKYLEGADPPNIQRVALYTITTVVNPTRGAIAGSTPYKKYLTCGVYGPSHNTHGNVLHTCKT